MSRKFIGALCLGLGLAFSTALAWAQEYPSKPIRLVVPFPPGGGTDIVARTVAIKLGEILRVSVVVENRAGAGGTVGTDVVARAPADGYTLGLVSGSHVINPSIYPKLPYDTQKAFAPVTLLVAAPAVLVVNKALPVNNVQELIALAKSRPGKLFFASAGVGTPPHLAGELFKSMAGIDITHVPYKGNGQVMTETISGEVAFTFPTLPSAVPFVKDGQLRALGVTGSRRSPSMPTVPTISESGLAGYESSSWYGVLAPAGTPPAVIQALSKELAQILEVREMRDKLAAVGLEIWGAAPAPFAAYINAEIGKWKKVARASGIRGE